MNRKQASSRYRSKEAVSPLSFGWNQKWIPGLLLVIGILIAYQQTWYAGFIWDDDFHLTQNPCIIGPLGFKEIWTTPAAIYYPLVLTNFWVQHALWGLNPLPYHLVNVAMHAACGILLWQVLRRLNVPGAWLGAAIWALHPVQVESVAWITELKNTQSCFFYLLTILFFLKWRETSTKQDRPAGWSYAWALLCALLAILSKSSTVMLPVVLGLCWWWIDTRWRWRNVVPLIPFLLVSFLAAVWTIWEQRVQASAIGPEWTQTWPERLVIAGRAIWFYLGKLAWPQSLFFIYPRWKIDASEMLVYLPPLAVIGALLILWWNRNGRLRPCFFSTAYFVTSLFPVLDFFNVYFFRYTFVADHFQYLASIGPLVLLAAGLSRLPRFIPGMLLVLLAFLTWKQVSLYRNLDTLWRDTLNKNPTSWMAQNNFAMVLAREGKKDEAIAHFQQALEFDSDKFEIHHNLGSTLLQLGRVNESLPYLQKTLELEPNQAQAQYELGNALLQTGLTESAMIHLQKALEIEPNYVPALSMLGSILLQKGRINESFEHLQRALEIDPNYKAAHFNLANTLLQIGRVDEAVSHLQKVLTIDPSDAEAQKNLAWVLATSPEPRVRNGAKAVELAEHANQLTDGRNPIVMVTLAAAYAETGRFPDAIRTAEAAIQLASDSGNLALAQGIRAHLELYRSGQPFRDIR